MLRILFGFWWHEIWKLFCFRFGVSYWVMYTCKNSVAWPLDNKIYRHCLDFRLFETNCCLNSNLRVNLYVIKPKPTKEGIADFVCMQRRSPAVWKCDFDVCLYCHYLFCRLPILLCGKHKLWIYISINNPVIFRRSNFTGIDGNDTYCNI